MKKFLSVILAAILLFSVMPYTALAQETSYLSYEFTGVNADDPGYAEGTITFTAGSSSTYYIYWGDEERALQQYLEIASFTVEKGGSATYSFSPQTAIPADAKCIFVSKSNTCERAYVSENIAKFDIPESKRLVSSSGDRQYRYAALSDIHIDTQLAYDTGNFSGFYSNSTKHWEQTLDDCVNRDVDFIITAGDDVTNADGATLEWLTYQQILAESDYVNPIYESAGNHEPRGSYNHNCGSDCSYEEFAIGTGLNDNTDDINATKQYFEITEPNTGDHFIFMGEVHAHPGENDNFSKEQLDWLEGLLNKYKDDGNKIFLIQHALLQGYGAGDDTYDPGYQGGIRMEHAETGEQFPNNQRFKSIIEEHKEIIWYSGHTHLDFKENQNYSSENGTSCHMVHIPSACNTTSYYKDENGIKYLGTGTDYTFYEDTTQGYFVDVYEDATILYGTNLHYNKVYPAYTYLIEEREPDVRPTQPIVERPTMPGATQPDIENGKTVYCVNSANWDEVYVYAWVDGVTVSWPGYPMTKTGEKVNGFDVYSAEIEADYTGVIFNNNDKGSQTSDLIPQENQYYDVKSGAWYNSLSDVPEVEAFSTDRYLAGEFNGWSTVANEFKLRAEGDRIGYITMELAANKTYQFKVVREGTWTSNHTPITGDVSGLVFSKSNSNNATITTTYAGEYVFAFGLDNSQLSVTYPKAPVTEPTETQKPTQATEPTETQKPTQATEPTETQKPTETQEPTEATKPTETQEPTQATKPTETEPTEPEIMYGDVDMDSKLSILDATFIQRHLAKLVVLTDEQMERAMVSGEEKLSILDATTIQRKLAKIIDKFPVEVASEKSVVQTAATNSTSVMTKAGDYLSAYFQYASYNDYQALKKVYYKYKDTDISAMTAQQTAQVEDAIAAFDTLRSKVHMQTVYFTDGNSFGNIRAYYWNSASEANVDDWPGQKAALVYRNSYGQNIYAVTLNYSKFDSIVFSSGGNNQTADIALDGKSGTQYYPTDKDSQGHWLVESITFKKMWY